MAELSTGTLSWNPATVWPDKVEHVATSGLKAAVQSYGGWARVLPSYFAARPRRSGLLLSEFLALGLMEREPKDARDFIGSYGAAKLALSLNSQSNRRGLVADKLLCDAMLKGAGFTVPETLAVFGRPAGPGIKRLERHEDLETLLAKEGAIFGKPIQGDRSQDVLALKGLRDGVACSADGRALDPGQIWAHLQKSHRGSGFAFQRHIQQNPKIENVVGQTVATVRVITVRVGGKVHLYNAFWKIPVGQAIADNFWRGNLLAPVDPISGEVGKALDVLSVDAPRVSIHPDTGAEFAGWNLPRWARVKKTVTAAAGLLHVLPVIGWDIAIGPHNPIIVEANANPSLDLPQYLTGQGALSGENGALLCALKNETQKTKSKRRLAKRAKRKNLLRQRLGWS